MTTAQAALLVSGVAAFIALYGATNAHRALRWQRRRDAERREQRVRIHFEHAAIAEPTSEGATFMIGGPQNLPLYYRLRIVVVNASETSAVWIRSVHLEQADGDIGYDLTERDSGAHRLEPGEPLVCDFPIDRQPHDFSRVIVRAHVAPNEWISSEPEAIDQGLLSHIWRHNSRGALDGPPGGDDKLDD